MRGKKATAALSPAGDRRTGPPPIVLLVHSDARARAAYAAALESEGMWVSIAADREEALEAVEDLRPDAVIVSAGAPPETATLVDRMKELPVMRGRALLVLRQPLAPRALVATLREQLDTAQQEVPPADVHETRNDAAAPPTPPPADPTHRTCPECHGRLDWLERGMLDGAEYDYYRWCTRGCGLYCYDLAAGTWMKLA